MFNPHYSLQTSDAKSRGHSLRHSAAFSATRTATAAPDERMKVKMKKTMELDSLGGLSPK